MLEKRPKNITLATRPQFPRPMVMTNGVFDLLHAGHVRFLETAAAMGRCLVVAVNSDASASKLGKGSGRPIVGSDDRRVVLSALACVDYVIEFDEPTAASLVSELRPDIYVKGGDYTITETPEGAAAEKIGAKVYALDYLAGYSTTDLVERIRRG